MKIDDNMETVWKYKREKVKAAVKIRLKQAFRAFLKEPNYCDPDVDFYTRLWGEMLLYLYIHKDMYGISDDISQSELDRVRDEQMKKHRRGIAAEERCGEALGDEP